LKEREHKKRKKEGLLRRDLSLQLTHPIVKSSYFSFVGQVLLWKISEVIIPCTSKSVLFIIIIIIIIIIASYNIEKKQTEKLIVSAHVVLTRTTALQSKQNTKYKIQKNQHLYNMFIIPVQTERLFPQ
jgi:hypothetical protein